MTQRWSLHIIFNLKLKYLSKVTKNKEGKNYKSIKNFDEAIKTADSLDKKACSGLTKTSTGYSLRVGPVLKDNPPDKFNSGMASWTRK